ncbi:MAG: tyrosine-type recombinase/integrase [Cyclobacteriaceae bacterium]
MTSIRAVLRTNKIRKDGTSPIAIRITKSRRTKYVFTGKYILEKDWDSATSKVKKSFENSSRLNAFIRKKIREVEEITDNAEISNQELSLNQIKNKAKRGADKVSFFQLSAERIKQKHLEGVYSVSKSELSILYNINEFLTHNPNLPLYKSQAEIKKRRKERISNARAGRTKFTDEIADFMSNQNLNFSEIDMSFLKNYKSFCASHLEQKSRTISNQLIFIRTIFNLAIKENLVDPKIYPFGGENERIKLTSGNKIGLSREEVKRIESLDLTKDSEIWHTRNIWLFSYYFAGMRISDVLELKWSDFIDNRLYYEMNKNHKPVSLKIPEQAQNILSEYSEGKRSYHDFVFPFLKKADISNNKEVFTKSRNAAQHFNKYLKRIAKMCDINKNLSNHIARHTFGNIAGDKVHPLMLQKLYRHSDLKTTIQYQSNFIHKEADDALDSVINS